MGPLEKQRSLAAHEVGGRQVGQLAAAARGRLLLVATVSLLPSLLQGHKQLPPPPDCQATGIPVPPTPSFPICVCVDPGMKLPSVSCAVRAQSSFVSIILCAENTIGKFVPRPSVKSGPHTLIVREASRTLQGKHRLLRFQKYVSVRLRL